MPRTPTQSILNYQPQTNNFLEIKLGTTLPPSIKLRHIPQNSNSKSTNYKIQLSTTNKEIPRNYTELQFTQLIQPPSPVPETPNNHKPK